MRMDSHGRSFQNTDCGEANSWCRTMSVFIWWVNGFLSNLCLAHTWRWICMRCLFRVLTVVKPRTPGAESRICLYQELTGFTSNFYVAHAYRWSPMRGIFKLLTVNWTPVQMSLAASSQIFVNIWLEAASDICVRSVTMPYFTIHRFRFRFYSESV